MNIYRTTSVNLRPVVGHGMLPPSCRKGRRMDAQETESVEECAERLGLSVEAVRKRARRGTLPAVKVAGRLRILKPPERTRPAQAVSSQQPDTRDAEVAYLRGQLDRANATIAQLSAAVAAEGARRDEMIAALHTITLEQRQIRETVAAERKALQPKASAVVDVQPQQPAEVIEVKPESPAQPPRPWWRFWRR